MKVLDLFCGLRGWSTPFAERGHETFGVDMDARFEPDLLADVAAVTLADLPWRPDIILASPPCEKFSVLRIGYNWTRDHRPRNEAAAAATELVWATRRLVEQLDPKFFLIENPVGKLRRLPPLKCWERRTVTYCQYGAPWRKPTDLWGGFPLSLELRPCCKPRRDCHVRVPGGNLTALKRIHRESVGLAVDSGEFDCHIRALTRPDGHGDLADRARLRAALYGTWDKRVLAAVRAKIPEQLATDVCLAAERDLAAGLTWRTVPDGRLFA